MQEAQLRQQQQADKHRREVDFGVGDSVWVSTKTWKADRPSKKLDFPMAGPYRILEKIGNSYKINFPLSIKVYLVIPPEQLQKAADDPLLGQIADPPLPINVNGETEWEVEKILAVRLYCQRL